MLKCNTKLYFFNISNAALVLKIYNPITKKHYTKNKIKL